MLASVKSCGITGIDGYIVTVEVDARPGMPTFEVVGLPDAAVKESRERVRAAISNSKIEFPFMHTTVNLAPADVKKEGPLYDLPIAAALLMATGRIPQNSAAEYVMAGELSLDGAVRSINGALPMVISARQRGVRKFILPLENALECACILDVEIYPAKSLEAVVGHLTGERPLAPREHVEYDPLYDEEPAGSDLKYVRGQRAAKRALEIAAAGGHNLLMIGSPGSGKTMLARCLPSILPPMTFEEALEITKIHSVSGALGKNRGLMSRRPFRAPHHTASSAALVGGGKSAMPGEISKAHNGVLFLDELPEFPRNVLEALRQPMEDGQVMVVRVGAQVAYPSRFMMVCAMNPCPCGHLGARNAQCRCTPAAVSRYLGRISGPLLDRIDMHIEVESINVSEISSPEGDEEPSAVVRQRVESARKRQLSRYEGQGIFSNAQLGARQLQKYCAMTVEARALMEMAAEKMGLSTRGYTRMLKVARTIADLAGEDKIGQEHVAEAVQYRSLDRKYWS
ncbi:MAG: YifB family Mg chelatase-like AAA ATPase [Christensenellales bacterium]